MGDYIIFVYLALILLISFLWAIFSLRDYSYNEKIKKTSKEKKIAGRIVFFKNMVKRYESSSSSSESSR